MTEVEQLKAEVAVLKDRLDALEAFLENVVFDIQEEAFENNRENEVSLGVAVSRSIKRTRQANAENARRGG